MRLSVIGNTSRSSPALENRREGLLATFDISAIMLPQPTVLSHLNAAKAAQILDSALALRLTIPKEDEPRQAIDQFLQQWEDIKVRSSQSTFVSLSNRSFLVVGTVYRSSCGSSR